MTYFRGDLTRPIDLEKIDVVQEEGPDQGKVTSVTHIRTVDATMFDNGNGLDTANVVANGPGRLEIRPDRDQPVERIAIWQDKLYVRNELGPDGRSFTRSSTSRATAPASSTRFKRPRSTRLIGSECGSSRSLNRLIGQRMEHAAIRVAARRCRHRQQGDRIHRNSQPRPTVFLEHRPRTTDTPAGDHHARQRRLGGGNFQIEHLLAIRDVH